MQRNTLRAGGMLLMIIGISFLSACSFEYTGAEGMNIDDCSRRSILSLSEGEFSGWGYEDDVLTALAYVYKSDELKAKYGSDFDIDKIPEANSEGNMIIPRSPIYKGKTECRISIDGDQWLVIVEKSYFGKWEVKNCCRRSN